MSGQAEVLLVCVEPGDHIVDQAWLLGAPDAWKESIALLIASFLHLQILTAIVQWY